MKPRSITRSSAHPGAIWTLLLALAIPGPPITSAQPATATPPPGPAEKTPAKKPPSESDRRKSLELESKVIAAFSEGRFPDAEKLLREQLTLQPDNFVVFYNLACALTAQGDTTEGMDFLVKSIESGFDDLQTLKRDPSLTSLRGREQYKQIIENWPALLDARRYANIQSVKEFFSGSYSVQTDDRLRIVIVSAVNERSLDVAREELRLLGEWAGREIFPGMLDDPLAVNDPWVVVVLPTREDFVKWIVSRHGADAITGMSSIGGEYDHDTKLLIAQDLGSSLRHEFFHVLHWRSCMRLAQRHPIWIQEGLCSLVEDYTLAPDGSVRPQTSWRSNIVKRLERVGQLKGLEELCKMNSNQFMAGRVLASYARARTAFLFLSDRGKLGSWYKTYTESFADDPSGLQAWERTLGMPIKQVDLTMRGWVRQLDMVPEQITSGMASLGVEVESGGADGLQVTGIVDGRRIGGPFLNGDVITDIDGRSTRDIAELVRVLGGYKPGDKVQVGIRRGKRFKTEPITLVAKR